MAEGLRQIASLDDPVGEILSMKVRPNGLRIGQKRVPLGVVGIIYESRPNVTADAFGLCFKTGNAVILRGGSDAIYSNQAIVRVIKAGLRKEKLCQDLVLLVEDTSREVVNEMMKMHGLIDVLIPRGGAGLIANVVATVRFLLLKQERETVMCMWMRRQISVWRQILSKMQRHRGWESATHVNRL